MLARQLAVFLVCVAGSIAWHEQSARAEEPEETRSSLVTVHGSAGLGGSQLGPGVRAALSGEGWFTEHLGVGAFGGAIGGGTSCFSLGCSSQNETMQFVGGTFAVRTAPRKGYGLFTFGAGYTQGRQWQTNGFRVWGPSFAPPESRFTGGVADLSAAYLFHHRMVEIGPAMNIDVTTWGSIVTTINLTLGFAP